MLEGASSLSDQSASSRKFKEVITDEPHVGKLARVVLPGVPDVSNNLAFSHCWCTSPNYSHLFWNNIFKRDNFIYFYQILLLLSTAGTISMCFDFSEQERFDAFESIILISLPTHSMLFMISAHDSIAMYLASLKRMSKLSTEAGSKYLILGAFSSGILLFGHDRTTIDIY
ncbi:hypothetical protein V2J09_018016 [Rumex salicifolius]